MSEFKSVVQAERLGTDQWTTFRKTVTGEEAQVIGEGIVMDTGMVYFEDRMPRYIYKERTGDMYREVVKDLIKEGKNPSVAFRVSSAALPPPGAVDVSVEGCKNKFGRVPLNGEAPIKAGDKVMLKAWRSKSGSVIYGF